MFIYILLLTLKVGVYYDLFTTFVIITK